MKKLKLFTAVVAALLCGNAMAQKVTFSDVTISANSTAELTVSLESEEVASLVEFTLNLPEGITLASDDEGYLDPAKGELLGRNHVFTVKDKNEGGTYVNVYNPNGGAFKAAAGTLFVLTLQAGEIAEGEATISVADILVSNTAAQKINTETSATVKVTVSTTTGVNSISAESISQGEVYNILGQKMNTVKKGLCIINGRKVSVR